LQEPMKHAAQSVARKIMERFMPPPAEWRRVYERGRDHCA
jgi:hypothetical protein